MQPPSTPIVQGEPLYEAFYGLREQPFALTTDPRFLFLSASHRRAHDDLLAGLRRREGLLVLTGETGTGKTTLCRAVLNALGQRTFSALILNPYMSDAEVLRVILRDFGLVSRDEIRRGALAKADMPQLLDTLESFLRSLLPLQSYAVVVIDEAQSLSPVVLDQIRMLGAFEQDGQRLLQIVLVGQPLLTQTIQADSLRALNERITRRATLAPLGGPEVDEYIRHRLTVAGGGAVSFGPEAVSLITDLSQGLPRRVNVLCDRALEEGRVSGSSTIDAAMVRRASRATGAPQDAVAAESEPELTTEPAPSGPDFALTFGQPVEEERRSRNGLVLAMGLLLLAAIGAGAYYYYAQRLLPAAEALPPLPAEVELDVGAPPDPIPIRTDEEISGMLAAAAQQQQ